MALAGAGAGEGLVGWAWDGLAPGADLDGLPFCRAAEIAGATDHDLGVRAVDHVVVMTGDLDRTISQFDAAGMERRRVRDVGELRQAFYLAGPALVEVVGPARADGAAAALWGITLVVDDLDEAAARLGEAVGGVLDAVQSGRRIATVRRSAALGVPVALMTRRPDPGR